MVRNAGEIESQPFLRQMGERLAEAWPLPESDTLGELETNMNRFLTLFQWGVISLHTGENGLLIRHQALPVGRDPEQQMRWCNAFCTILEGLYSCWLHAQGGGEHVVLQRERLNSISDVQFHYYHP